MAGIQYKHPFLYNLLLPIIHRKSVLQEFSRQVGKNVSVFDVAAGFGGMAKHIDAANAYRGIDLNKAYIEHAQKNGLDVQAGDIFHQQAYVVADVLILVDVVHHMPQEQLQKLFDLVFQHATQRVVIMEPCFVNLHERYGIVGRPVDWMLRKLDHDGLNTIERWFSEAEYRAMFISRFSSKHGKKFKVRIQKIYPYWIVTYSRT